MIGKTYNLNAAHLWIIQFLVSVVWKSEALSWFKWNDHIDINIHEMYLTELYFLNDTTAWIWCLDCKRSGYRQYEQLRVKQSDDKL